MQLGIFGISPARSVQDRRRAAGRNFVDDHRARNISDAANLRQGVLPNFDVDCEEGLAADVLGKAKRPHGKSGMSHDSQSRHLDNCSAERDAPGEAEFMHGCAELVIYAAVALVPHDKNATVPKMSGACGTSPSTSWKKRSKACVAASLGKAGSRQ